MDYQRKKNNKYILPAALYNQVIWLIRDYYRLREEANNLLYSDGMSMDGLPRGNKLSNETELKAMKREDLMRKINTINKERDKIPGEYRQGVWDNIMYRTAYPPDADRTTYARYKSRFIYGIAKALFWI